MDPEEEFMPPSKKQKCTQAEDPIVNDAKSCAVREDDKPVTVSVAQPDASLANHLSEKDVGITEYVGKHSGFFAVLKQRYPCVGIAVSVHFVCYFVCVYD